MPLLPLLLFLDSGSCDVRKSFCADSEGYNSSLELFHGAEAGKKVPEEVILVSI